MQDNDIDILIAKVDTLLEKFSYFPKFISLSTLSEDMGISNQTLRNYLLANFEVETDFYKKGGRIFLNSGIVPMIKEHYEKKK